MYYFINAEKDSTLYGIQPEQNTGLDEILEISKTYTNGVKDIAHTLIKFPLSGVLAIGDGTTLGSTELILRECEASEVPVDYSIYAYPVSQSWDMGIGTRFDEISSVGVTWENRTTSIEWEVTGSDYYVTPTHNQDFQYESADIVMDVIDIINAWRNETIPNDGFILKYSNIFEVDSEDYGNLKFFGKETNTIYQPKLRVGWEDAIFITTGLEELTDDDISISFKRLKVSYKTNSVPRIGVFGRELYPLKEYNKQYSYTDIKYLPQNTYYQIKDVITDEIIIPFGDYSKVSCDTDGNYFKLNFENWEINREYYIEIKVEDRGGNGTTEYFSDNGITFVVE